MKTFRNRRRSARPAAPAAGTAITAAALAVRRAAEAEREHPPEGNFVTVEGIKLHFTDTGGASTPLVLLHGNGVTSADWHTSGVTRQAAGRHRVIAFDRPGFGYSERPRTYVWTPAAQADLIKAALDAIGVANPIVAGHSWGALVAAALASRYPSFVRGVVLVSGYYFPSFRADSLLFSPGALPVLGDVLRYTVFPFTGRAVAPFLIQKMFAPCEVPERFLEQFPVSISLRPWQMRAFSVEAAGMVPAAALMQSAYRSLRVPAVIIAGDADQITDFDRNSLRLHQLIQGSKLHAVPGAGHMVHYYAPDAIVSAAASFSTGETVFEEAATSSSLPDLSTQRHQEVESFH